MEPFFVSLEISHVKKIVLNFSDLFFPYLTLFLHSFGLFYKIILKFFKIIGLFYKILGAGSNITYEN